MSTWAEHTNRYPTKLDLTPEELQHASILFKEIFAANIEGKRILFAHWETDSLYSQGIGHSWYSLDDNSRFGSTVLQKGFPNYEQIQKLDVYEGTGTYQGKAVQWDRNRHQWSYLNHRMVHFNNSATSSADHSSPDSPAEDDIA